MREIDLSKFDIRTDLIIDSFNNLVNSNDIDYKKRNITNDIIIEEFNINNENSFKLNTKEGKYRCISFNDITDHTNYCNVLDAFTLVFKDFLKELDLDLNKKCMIVGLGNRNSTPDAIGPKCLDNIIVTHHLLEFGPLENGYRDIMILEPSVTAITGIESKNHILGLINIEKPDFLIVIDALKTTSIERMTKTIQISDSGIIPGSGVHNNRKELTKKDLNIPVISIGIPTIIDSATIVYDTLKILLRKISYEKNNFNNYKNKMSITKEYKEYKKELNINEKKEILGILGTLEDDEIKKLFTEVLNPIDYNLMVTPKEIDFLVDKVSLLISEGLNRSLNIINDKNII